MTAVAFDRGVAEPVLGKPQALFADEYDLGFGNTIANYDVMPDGRFLRFGGNLRAATCASCLTGRKS
jgi:hypothetical protein